MDLEKIRREVCFVVRYRYFYNPFAFVVSALIFLHCVYITLPSEWQDCILEQKGAGETDVASVRIICIFWS